MPAGSGPSRRCCFGDWDSADTTGRDGNRRSFRGVDGESASTRSDRIGRAGNLLARLTARSGTCGGCGIVAAALVPTSSVEQTTAADKQHEA